MLLIFSHRFIPCAFSQWEPRTANHISFSNNKKSTLKIPIKAYEPASIISTEFMDTTRICIAFHCKSTEVENYRVDQKNLGNCSLSGIKHILVVVSYNSQANMFLEKWSLFISLWGTINYKIKTSHVFNPHCYKPPTLY